MTDEQINRAIAEACGWIFVIRDEWESPSGDLLPSCSIPHYCSDLNAMHEAEKVLTEVNWFYYTSELARIVRLPNQPEVQIKQSIHATARQRAKAFLRTLGKWEEVTA